MTVDLNDERLSSADFEGDMLLYDFFKHVTSMSVLALGGILVIVQSIAPEQVQGWKVLTTFGLVAFGGVSAFHGASEIVKAKTSGTKPGKLVYRLRMIAPTLLAGGVGVFLSLFLDALGLS